MNRNPTDKNDRQLIYGTRAIIEAVHAGKEFERLYVQKNLRNELISELLDVLKQNRIHFSTVPKEKLNSITRKNHQGVAGFISPVSFASLDHVISSAYSSGRAPFLLLLDRITDVRNFGAICRTAESAGVDGIVIPITGSAPLNSDAMKTSAGALNYIPVCREVNFEKTISYLKENGLMVIGCTEKASDSIYDLDLSGPVAIIMGSEENGIMPKYLSIADKLARLPMNGKISSLNVSVATGIALYETVRQRG